MISLCRYLLMHRAGCISALTPDRSDRCLACILDRRSRSCGALADHMPENGGYKLIFIDYSVTFRYTSSRVWKSLPMITSSMLSAVTATGSIV